MSLKWEGNESSMRDFDDVLASSTRPALISPMHGPLSPGMVTPRLVQGVSQSLQTLSPSGAAPASPQLVGTPQLEGVRVVGNMVFDPVKVCWFSTGEDGEEELDFGDDEADAADANRLPDAWEGGEQMRLRTRRSFAMHASVSENGEECEDELDMNDFARKTRDAAHRHYDEMKPWRSLARADTVHRRQLWGILDVSRIGWTPRGQLLTPPCSLRSLAASPAVCRWITA